MPEGSSKPRDLTSCHFESGSLPHPFLPPVYRFFCSLPWEQGLGQRRSGYGWGFAFDMDIDQARFKIQLRLQKKAELSPGHCTLRWTPVMGTAL